MACYRSVSDEAALAQHAARAGPVIQAHRRRFLARGVADRAYEAGVRQPVVVIEFDSLEKAVEAYESPDYQAALGRLRGGPSATSGSSAAREEDR
jgi:uncharacterized protein (DUF1330 family)